jgi:Protein of unknown function (DUF1475)
MIILLRCLFTFIMLSMIGLSFWAADRCAIWAIPAEVSGHPWFIATLVDAYWGFITFYCWVVYKEASWLARILWLLGILVLGNIAMAGYVLVQLLRVPATAAAADVLLRRR